MLRLLGILTLGNMIFGGHRCHCHHHRYGGLGRGLLLGALIGLFLGIAGKKFYVAPDTRVEEVLAMLPGYNCGGCGNPGCAGMATKLVDGETTIDKCKPCKAEAKQAIIAYLAEHAG